MATPIHITSADDPLIEPYRDIRERDLVGRQGRFIAEGEVVLRQMLGHGRHPLESVLLSERRATNDPLLVAAIPTETSLLIASDDVIQNVAGFHVHRGVLGIGLRDDRVSAASLLGSLPAQAAVVICIGIANHDNIGGIFRNAAAFGAAAVLLDSTCCDPLYRKAIRVSVGATVSVPFARGGSAQELLDTASAAGFALAALSPAGTHMINSISDDPRIALVLGAEGPGLPPDILARTRTFRVRMVGDIDSLNVATTSGIALHAILDRKSHRS